MVQSLYLPLLPLTILLFVMEKIKIESSTFLQMVISSDIKVAPESINLKAKSDLPNPEFPTIKTPESSITTEVAWIVLVHF